MHQKNMKLLSDNWENINKKVIEPLWRHKFESKYLAVKLDKDDFLSLVGEELTKAFETYDGSISNVYTYATNVLTRKAKTEIRNMKRQKRLGELYAESIYQKIDNESDRTIEDLIENESEEGKSEIETELVLKEIFLLLKPKERKILKLSLDGLSNKDIADKLNMNLKMVNDIKRKNRERSDINRILSIHGFLGGNQDEI